MNQLLLITKTALRNQFGLNRFFKSGRPPWLKLVLAALIIGLGTVGALDLLFTYSFVLSQGLQKFGLLHLLLMQAILLPALACFFTGIYTAPGQLFFCKDYDLLLSLPLRTSTVVMSKLASVLLSNSVLAAVLALPPLIIYGWKTGAGPVFYLLAVVTLPFIPLVPLTVAAVFALFTGRIAARFKRSNAVLSYLTLVLLIGLMAGYFELSNWSRPATASINAVLDAIKTWYPPARFYFDALRGPSLSSLLMFVGLSAGAFVLFCVVFARFLKVILSNLGATPARANYQLKTLAASPVLRALYLKELKGYLSCPIYLLNTSFGMVMLTMLAVSTVCLGGAAKTKILQQAGMGAAMPLIALLVVVFSTVICCTTASTISLEGRSLWILKTAPVSPLMIFKSKVLVNLSVTLPFVAVNSVILALGLRFGLRDWLLVWGVPSAYALLIAIAGLLINLLYPKLEFKNPAAVVKQSASALLSFIVSFASLGIPAGLYAWLRPKWLSGELYAGLVAVAALALTTILWQVVRTKGVRWFERLN